MTAKNDSRKLRVKFKMQSQHGFIQVDNSVFSALKDNKREHSSGTYIYFWPSPILETE